MTASKAGQILSCRTCRQAVKTLRQSLNIASKTQNKLLHGALL